MALTTHAFNFQRRALPLSRQEYWNFNALSPLSPTMPGQKIESGHQDIVHDVTMDYYGKRLATASSDNTVKIIGVTNTSSQHLATLTGHSGPVWQAAWAHPKWGSLLASCSYDGKVIIWKEGNQNEWTQAHVFDDHKSSVNSISWAPHEIGLCLACGSSDGNISVFTARSDGGWDRSRIDQAHPAGVTSVSWAPFTAPGSLVGSGILDPVMKLASGGCDSTVKVWKFDNGNWRMDCFPALSMHTDWVRDVAWAPNLGLPKSTIASASEDGKVIVWTSLKEGDQWDGRVLKDFGAPVWRVSWSITGNILAVADGTTNVTLWKEAVDGEWQQQQRRANSLQTPNTLISSSDPLSVLPVRLMSLIVHFQVLRIERWQSSIICARGSSLVSPPFISCTMHSDSHSTSILGNLRSQASFKPSRSPNIPAVVMVASPSLKAKPTNHLPPSSRFRCPYMLPCHPYSSSPNPELDFS